MKKNRLMIIGGNSFVARHFREHVVNNHAYEIEAGYSIDREKTSTGDFFVEEVVDVLNERALIEAVLDFKPNYIVNFVGSFSFNTTNDLIRLNVGVSNTLCEAVIEGELRLKKMLFIGSAAEYGYPDCVPISEDARRKPVNPYGLSKVMQASALDYYSGVKGLPIVLARTFNIIGKGISTNLSIGAFKEKIQKSDQEGVMTVGNLTSKRDFLDVRDVVSAYWNLLQCDQSKGVYNVCRGESVSMNKVVELMVKASGKRIHIESDAVLQKEFDVDDIYGDNSLLKIDTSWTPKYSLEKSINHLFSS